MNFLDLTRPTAAENLALDEALLLAANQGVARVETLRIWEEPATVVIVGRGSRVEDEVNVNACQHRKITVLRRCSGGCTVVAGPGCLMYSVILDLRRRRELRVIDRAHAFVLQRLHSAITTCVSPESGLNVSVAGLSDLVVEPAKYPTKNAAPLKFSGNSLRITRDALLYHGTILYDFSLELVGQLLRFPPRQPDYRADRAHEQFITNLPIEAASIRAAIRRSWRATKHTTVWPEALMEQLVVEKYSRDEWNSRH